MPAVRHSDSRDMTAAVLHYAAEESSEEQSRNAIRGGEGGSAEECVIEIRLRLPQSLLAETGSLLRCYSEQSAIQSASLSLKYLIKISV